MNISELLARNARKFPDKTAIIDGNEELSYAEVDRTVNRLASSLARLGIRQGDKVILYMPNTKEFVFAYFAALRLGAIVVPANARLTASEVQYILHHSEAKAVIAHEWICGQIAPLVGQGNVVWIKTGEAADGWVSMADLIAAGSPAPVVCPLNEADEATILYTSGTTGRPKGVLFTNRNIFAVATMMVIEAKMDRHSRILHMMPLSHSAPLHLFFVGGTYVGATHVLAPAFSPEALLQLVEQHEITHFFGAPVAYLLAAKHPRLHDYNLSSVRYWTYGGAPLSRTEVLFIASRFRTDRLMCLYGLTEAGPNGTYLSPEEHAEKAGSVGKYAALHCEVKIVDDQGKEVPPGEIGEIALRGESVMKGYYKDEEKTKETMKDGWLYTGDLARRDEDGYIWVIDRKKDIIISGGVNIYPKEVEDVLRTHPDIVDVAVIGVPHPEWGETAKAFVVAGKPLENLAEICKRFLKGKIADYKIPRLYEQIEELPRNATGKVLKQVLRGKYDETAERR
ncbi:class I adenylate-forming enzyme family protein [Parageobacillus thermoglucosidasius]|uniref:AMP-dependent synthetase and ligase n=1 Tax=Geobacillus sp. (strain Y4.1MC1) TaxID=581103 RepID=A0A7U3YEX8_GEOS0|nr:long-chain-fatty-acid--CoA ligase [Parageobacillus thermoglucosidasius]KYD16051.1 Long-chain-fatty-acid--CoA ligase [Anoxybacillus flavithermus]REK58171.1 MAG: o-succinylbenzoate--CoA ligase [Geobacillus sp.]AEH47621.1 o-succinylbenzoate--CoA ligase [Parageobacillus thermoglucosidasius C56-YS93]EID44675.1 acyl-CoA ligase, AMP-dependent [Parageobacillus thermoglucosidasius TNO-09.020]MED4905688.1 long-chain-fatty-acid--CoA ligase [Parageobacillus thermoglucosidasius]